MADFNATSASNARPRRRHREAGADMMETDVDSGSSHMTHRTGTSGQATTGLGAGQTEIRMEKAREFLNMVKTIAAKQPEIEKEFDALEMMVSRSASVKTESELNVRISALERQLTELREENAQMKMAIDSSYDTNRRDGNIPLGKGNSDDKLKATEHLNYQLKEKMKELQQQNRDTEQNLEKSQSQLSQAMSEILKERKAREESQEQIKKWNELQNKYAAHFKKQKQEIEKMQQQLQENTETISALTDVKEHLNQMINVKESTIQEQKKTLDSERKELDETKSRLSKMMGNQMKDGNPYIADLSDKNRPTKIADLYNELYDNEWTDAFDVIQKTAYTGTEDKDIAKQLYGILMDINAFCKKEVTMQTNQIKQSLQVDDTGGTLVSSTQQQLKEFQRSNADCGVQGVCQKYTKYNRTRAVTLAHNSRKVPDFVRKCIEVCWIMSLQDPPLDFKEEFQSNAPFSKDEFKAYTKLGQYIDFVVWPPLLLYKRGPLLAKGVAQGWGKAEGGIKSPDVKNTEPSFPVERKQAWTSVANQAVSNPSTLADNSYSQSPLVPALTYPVSTVTYTQAPLTYNQALSPSSSDNRVLSQPTTTTRSTAEMQLSDILRDIAVNQNSNATQPYSQQTVGQHSSNDTQQGSVPQTFYENQGNQSGASQYGHGYHFNGYYYHY